MILSGLAYMNFNLLKNEYGLIFDLKQIALLHTFIAFFLVSFVIAHIYLTTTGFKPLSAIKAMITGWEEMSDEEAAEALKEYLQYSINSVEKTIDDNLLFNKTLEEISTNKGDISKLSELNIGFMTIDHQGNIIAKNEKIVFEGNIFDKFEGNHKNNLQENIKNTLDGKIITGKN
jgi:hypothetical protein